MRTLLILALALFVCIPDASARCRARGVEAYLITPADQVLTNAASLIVGMRGAEGRPGESGFPELTLVKGSTRIPLHLHMLSPLIAEYGPVRLPEPGRYRVTGLRGSVHVEFGGGRADRMMRAPGVRAVQRREQQLRRGVRVQMQVALSRPLPRSAIALVVEDDQGGLGGGAVSRGDTEVTVFDWGHRCQQWPDGLRVPPAVGQTVRVRVIDVHGRITASTEVTITPG